MGILSFIVALLIFTVVVTVHEFGHYLFAKRAGIKVEEFAIGMGPKLVSKEINDTVWSIRVLPLGGFCRMYGEDEAIEGDDEAFGSKSVFARFLVVLGGPLFNFILAMVVAILVFSFAGSVRTTAIGDFSEVSPIKDAGVEIGDRIVSYNGRDVYTFRELLIYINTDIHDEVEIEVVKSNQEKVTYLVKPYTDGKQYYLGFYSEVLELDNPVKIVEYAGREVIFNFRAVPYSLSMLFKGKAKTEDVSGPIGILAFIGEDVSASAEQGGGDAVWVSALSWLLLLSTNLGIMNLLPIPALDGGRIMFILIEAVRGKPLDRDKEGFIHFVGFVLLMGLMVFLLYNDITRLFR